MSATAPTPLSSENRKPSVSADDVQALRAVYAAYVAASKRINAAVEAGEACMALAPAHKWRASWALTLAIRGVITPGEASLEIHEAEFAAMSRKPLPLIDYGIEAVVSWHDAIRQPPRPPQSSCRPHPLKPNPAWHMKEQGDEYDRAQEERFTHLHDSPFDFDEPDDRDAA
ncbi:hypothetical protein SAMN02799631_06530 [Methylobacterium sp. 174MFSha1.1]|uniref:hypothetical protein n=1 Tax=Methylobacterium sp. 174MFSha1.1 TaxID=1502749 RepID=UPI0008E22430|nr:hypothetical protein [Methylobacterium sp. 174MFSha1.1]SFV16813.1 hypothetical protein SAMN02799631_06530 [Methylobacterium sp. 174MFSha1.1]